MRPPKVARKKRRKWIMMSKTLTDFGDQSFCSRRENQALTFSVKRMNETLRFLNHGVTQSFPRMVNGMQVQCEITK